MTPEKLSNKGNTRETNIILCQHQSIPQSMWDTEDIHLELGKTGLWVKNFPLLETEKIHDV